MGSDAEVVLRTTPPPVLLAGIMNIADRRLQPDDPASCARYSELLWLQV